MRNNVNTQKYILNKLHKTKPKKWEIIWPRLCPKEVLCTELLCYENLKRYIQEALIIGKARIYEEIKNMSKLVAPSQFSSCYKALLLLQFT